MLIAGKKEEMHVEHILSFPKIEISQLMTFN